MYKITTVNKAFHSCYIFFIHRIYISELGIPWSDRIIIKQYLQFLYTPTRVRPELGRLYRMMAWNIPCWCKGMLTPFDKVP